MHSAEPWDVISPPSATQTAGDSGSGVKQENAPLPDSGLSAAFAFPRTNGRQTAAATSISVVIPTLNEAENLQFVLGGLPHHYEVVVVDGRSTDTTVQTVRELRPDAHIIHQTGLGKGDALAEGFRFATGDVIVMLDADCSAAASEIPSFVEALRSGADFAKGSRYLPGGGSDDLTHMRSLGNRMLTRLVNLLYGTTYTDLCYGYNAFWRRLVPLFDVHGTGFEVETLMALKVAKSGLSVTEVPSFERSRGAGVSKLNTFRDGWRVLGAIVRERWRPGATLAIDTGGAEATTDDLFEDLRTQVRQHR